MIKVEEGDPVGEVDPQFTFRDVNIQKNVKVRDLYDMVEELGRGKFGTVYRCKEKKTGMQLAAKFILCNRKEDKSDVESEIAIMKILQHPRLLQLYDAFDDVNKKEMCLILELIEGGELFERVIDDDFVLTEKACVVFMRQICEGVEFIHSKDVLHLDMKPENILCLTRTGNRIKLIDFGLARMYDPKKKLQVLFGTPEFVAPEVVNFDAISYGTDMWSVGVICYVLLSGLSPFMGDNDMETMGNVTMAKYDYDDEAFDDISDDAKDFISKLLVKNINHRLSASQCLAHPWLRRRPSPQLPPAISQPPPQAFPTFAPTPMSLMQELDMAKDNLRMFVERWSQHPNSPYIFGSPVSNFCLGESNHWPHVSGSVPSLGGMSPSPHGSIASASSLSLSSYNATRGTRSRDNSITEVPDPARRQSAPGSNVPRSGPKKLTADSKLVKCFVPPPFPTGQSLPQPVQSENIGRERSHSLNNTNQYANPLTSFLQRQASNKGRFGNSESTALSPFKPMNNNNAASSVNEFSITKITKSSHFGSDSNVFNGTGSVKRNIASVNDSSTSQLEKYTPIGNSPRALNGSGSTRAGSFNELVPAANGNIAATESFASSQSKCESICFKSMSKEFSNATSASNQAWVRDVNHDVTVPSVNDSRQPLIDGSANFGSILNVGKHDELIGGHGSHSQLIAVGKNANSNSRPDADCAVRRPSVDKSANFGNVVSVANNVSHTSAASTDTYINREHIYASEESQSCTTTTDSTSTSGTSSLLQLLAQLKSVLLPTSSPPSSSLPPPHPLPPRHSLTSSTNSQPSMSNGQKWK